MRRRHTFPRAARRSLALLPLAVLLAIGPAACRQAPTDAVEVAVIGDSMPALGEATAVTQSGAQAVLRLNVAQGLVRFDAAGQVVPGLAERWNVSDDGLSYIFRMASGEWPDGRKLMARDIARIIKRQLRATKGSPAREALGAVTDVVAMTERVIEIRLAAPRPNLLELLAHPDLALIREGVGSGPFQIAPAADALPAADAPIPAGQVRPLILTRQPPGNDGEVHERENVGLAVLPAAKAIAAFRDGDTDLVLGGTLDDLPLVTRLRLPRDALRFDPAGGLFGLVPARADGPLAEPEVRALLDQAIDRGALITALAIPALGPRATVLQSGLEGLADPVQPPWLGQPLAERRPTLLGEAQRLFGDTERPVVRVALPPGPGGDLVFTRLFADWGAIGIGIERVTPGKPADLAFIDAVAPSTSPAWFLRQFRCDVVPICSAEADALLDQARLAPDLSERARLLAEAAIIMDEAHLFLALAAPVRWSLVGDRVPGYQDNRFARHPLADLSQRAPRGF